MVAHASVASGKTKVELDLHSDSCVAGNHCLVIYDHDRPIAIYSYNPKIGHRSANKVDSAVGYQDPQSGQKFILMINKAFHINGVENHLLCPMQCCLNSVHISEVPKFLAESPSMTAHAIDLTDPFDTAHLHITPHH